jgi:hypothetical protein
VENNQIMNLTVCCHLEQRLEMYSGLLLYHHIKLRYRGTFLFSYSWSVLSLLSGSTHQFEEELAKQMGFYIHAGRGTGNNVMIAEISSANAVSFLPPPTTQQ